MSSSFKASDLIAADIDAYLHQHQHKSLLRFITCGSVDDGKSRAERQMVPSIPRP
jgi:bifunctional enzyme CysN/CysC